MKSKLSLVLLMLVLFSCSHPGMKRRNVEQYFVSSGVTRYFLPELPEWANYSQSSSCYRKKSVRYFDMGKLRKSFSLTYAESMHFQLMFNYEKERRLDETSYQSLPLKEEEKIFYEISERVQSGAFIVRLPEYKRIHLVWIDPFITGRASIKILEKLMNSDEMGKGHPLFISLCLSNSEVSIFIEKLKLANSSIRTVSYEMFSIYTDDLERKPYMFLNFDKLFNKKQNIYLYSIDKRAPIEFQGKFNVKTY